MAERHPCAVCGVSPHRYGTTDPEHKYDAMGCVNMLLPLVEKLRAENALLRNALAASLDPSAIGGPT